MGRAYEVRKASIQKTGAIKGKIYSMYAKEIYLAAKNGGSEIESNASLKRLIERAKKEQVPSDIIKRAIDKVNSGIDESYVSATYEIFGPLGSTLLVDCLTDNVNRSVSDLRAAINKCHVKMGTMGSVSYMYDHLSIVGVSGLTIDEVMDVLISNDIDVDDIEEANSEVVIYGLPQDLFRIKEAVSSLNKPHQFTIEEIAKIPKEKVNLNGEELEVFKKLLDMLEEIPDVQNVYHNVFL